MSILERCRCNYQIRHDGGTVRLESEVFVPRPAPSLTPLLQYLTGTRIRPCTGLTTSVYYAHCSCSSGSITITNVVTALQCRM